MGIRALAVIIVVLAAGVGVAVWALSSDDEASAGGEVAIEFEQGPSRDLALIEGSFRRAVKTANRELELPDDIEIRVLGDRTARRLSVSDPRYEPGEQTVYFPWSFVDRSRGQLAALHRSEETEEREQVLGAAMEFVLNHELAHGLIDVLEVPVVGGEERTADSLATVFAIATRGGGEIVPLSAATLLRGPEGSRRETAADFAADHDLAPKRAYDAICLVYGSDPDRHADLVGGVEGLPASRLETCEFDYARELRSWRQLLAEWLTDEGGLKPPR